jgi:hypothetical protein
MLVFSRKLSTSYFLRVSLSSPPSLPILSWNSNSNSNLCSPESAISRPLPRSTISATPKYHILLYQKAHIFVRLAIGTKGYSQVMPLIVENSRTMSSPESRSVKRPSESASCIPLFCCFLSELKIWRMLCLLGFSPPPHERSRNQDQPPYLQKHPVFLSLSTSIFPTSILQDQDHGLFNIILAIATNLHHDVRNPISSSADAPTTRRRTTCPHTIHRQRLSTTDRRPLQCQPRDLQGQLWWQQARQSTRGEILSAEQ